MKDNPTNAEKRQAEMLSAAIDKLNQGQSNDFQDKEIAELVLTAKLLKEAANPSASPPPAVCNHIVDQVAGVLIQEKRKKRLTWALASLSGAVAAVVLVILFNAVPPAVQEQAKVPQAAPLPAGEAQPPSIAQTPPKRSEPPAQTQSQPPPVTEAMPNPAETEQATRPQPPLVALVPPSSSPAPASGGTMLALADRKADIVTIDAVTKTIRQVYHQAAPDEIIITQVPKYTGDSRAASRPAQVQSRMVAPRAKETVEIKPPNRNKITLTVDDVEVTLEGAVSEAELRNLAQTLTRVSIDGNQK